MKGKEKVKPIQSEIVTKSKKKATELTGKSMRLWRKCGWYVEKVEYWNAFARKRKDLFGIIDVLALHPEGNLCGIQVTSKSNMGARVKKIMDEKHSDIAVSWLSVSSHSLVVEGWYKEGNRWKFDKVEIYHDEDGELCSSKVRSLEGVLL